MSYAFVQDVPINSTIYAQIRANLGAEPPKGMIVHVVQKTERGLRYIDVWESEADWERFVEERLHPVVGKALAQAGFPHPPEEPPREQFEVVDVWRP